MAGGGGGILSHRHSALMPSCTLPIQTQTQGKMCPFGGGGGVHSSLTHGTRVRPTQGILALCSGVKCGTTGCSRSKNDFFTTFSGANQGASSGKISPLQRQHKRTLAGTFSAWWSWDLLYFKGWQLAAGGGWRRLVVGDWWLVGSGGWRLAVGGGWRLAVGGAWGWSFRAVLNKKKIRLLKDPPLVPIAFRKHVSPLFRPFGTPRAQTRFQTWSWRHQSQQMPTETINKIIPHGWHRLS